VSHFEYISVAIALIFALAVGRLLSGLSLSMVENRRYWVHLTWVFTLLLVSVMGWWLMWRAYGVTWTPIRFLCALLLPALIYVRAAVLLGNPADAPASFYDHFYEKRPLFFTLGLVTAGFLAVVPWIFGMVPWFTLAPAHGAAAPLFVISALGLCSRSPTVHAVLVILSLILAATNFFIIPVASTTA
jgi:hypothetical protein